jgi:hypothetical protein
MQSCFLRKKNRCNTCPKWTKVEQKETIEVKDSDV